MATTSRKRRTFTPQQRQQYVEGQGGQASSELSRMFNQQLGTDVAAHMRLGRGAPLNPPGTVWHHPVDNPDTLQLLRQVEHTNPALQPVLHPQGIGGFGTFYGP